MCRLWPFGWDEALSSGRLVWGTAGDDCHDLRSPHQTGKRYILVDWREDAVQGQQDEQNLLNNTGNTTVHPNVSLQLDSERLLAALRSGRFVSVLEKNNRVTRKLPPEDAISIVSFNWNGKRLTVRLDKPVEKALVIGPGGEIASTFEHVDQVDVETPTGVAYRRLVLRNGFHTVALNPIARVIR